MLVICLTGILLLLGAAAALSFLMGALPAFILLPWDGFHGPPGWFGVPGWFGEALGAMVLVTLFGLLLNGGYWIHVHLEDRRARTKGALAEGDVARRLDEVEARTRDVLDVMIALSEKMDHWEREGRPAARDRTPTNRGEGRC